MTLVGAQSNQPRLAAVPATLPKTQAEWQSVVNALQQWRKIFAGPTWTAPTLQNGWANYGSGYGSVGYWLDVSGRLWLRGSLTGAAVTGGLPSTLFVLPYAPQTRKALNALIGTASGTAVAELDVLTNGTVQLQSNVGAVPKWLSLDGLSFDLQP